MRREVTDAPEKKRRRILNRDTDKRFGKKPERKVSEKSLANLREHTGRGRVKGVPNKTTAILKDAILEGCTIAGNNIAERVGSDYNGVVAYCAFLAEEHPQAFSTLLGKVLPMQITGADGGPIQVTKIELVAVEPKPMPTLHVIEHSDIRH